MHSIRYSFSIVFLFLSIITFAQLPLLQFNDLEYEGAFIVPSGTFGESSSDYAAGAFALSADKQGFFIAGHNVEGAIAEFEMPTLVKSDSLHHLQYATIRQNFKSFMNLTPDGNPQSIDRVSGLKVIDDKLYINALEYYDAAGTNTHTTLVIEEADSLETSIISGYYHVEGEAHAAGWICDIPSEWSSTLGGDFLMGNSSKYPINSRSTMGVSAFVFDPHELVNNTTTMISSTTLLDFDLSNPLYAEYDNYANDLYNLVTVNGSTPPGHTFADAMATVGTNSLWTSDSQVSYGFIIPGTRTYMTVGSSGGHNSGIGYKAMQDNGNVCGGPCPYIANDVYNYYWLWDIDDLIDVKNGVLMPYDVRPYDHGVFNIPLQYDDYYDEAEFHDIIGGDFDAEKGILYLIINDAGASGSPYSRNPAIVTYHIKSSQVASNPILGLETVHTGFAAVTKITNATDGSKRLFIAEKTGKIKIIDSMGTILSTPFLDISGDITTNGERGLLGLAMHPDYATNGYFYVNYTNSQGNTEISRYTVSSGNANIADPNSAQVLLTYNQPYSNHNGGDINFGPQDGYLYIAAGDGGSANDPGCESQDISSALGKLLRIDVDVPNGNQAPYLIPADNPFVGQAGADETIWSYGLRNPWRFSFDRDNGDLWIADVGQNMIEEVDYDPAPLTAGINYGWKFMEGSQCLTGNTTDPDCDASTPPCNSPLYQNPIFEYTHNSTTGGFSITGGYVYRGCEYTALKGLYICADYSSGNFWTVDQSGSSLIHSDLQDDIVTFGEDEQGVLYCANFQGAIFKVVDTSLPSTLTLTAADSPLEGIYRANSEIILEGNLIIASGNVVTLNAPKVTIKNQLSTQTNNNLIILNGGCN